MKKTVLSMILVIALLASMAALTACNSTKEENPGVTVGENTPSESVTNGSFELEGITTPDEPIVPDEEETSGETSSEETPEETSEETPAETDPTPTALDNPGSGIPIELPDVDF